MQRICACGGVAGIDDLCEQCRSQRLSGKQSVYNSLEQPGPSHQPIEATQSLSAGARFGHDFSRIPVHSIQTAVPQTKLTINPPGDVYEQEADQVAERVMHMTDVESPVSDNKHEAENSLIRKQAVEPGTGVATQSTDVSPIVHDVLNSDGGQPLDLAARAFLEPHFGHDFSQVRVHTDTRAAASARAVNALAYTVGKDVVFGAGQYAPGTRAGRRLLAHELTHVAQQSHIGPALQAKLHITGKAGDVKRVETLLNSGLQQYRVSVDKSGNVSITQNFVEKPPNAQQKALADRLKTIINDPKDVIMTVSVGSKTLVGSYATGDIDIADLEAIGVHALIHEIEEQYQKQVRHLAIGSETTGAHGEGIKAESEIKGAKRGSQKVISMTQNPDGTMNAVVEIPFTYPGGKVKTQIMTIKKNNVVSVTWK